MLQVRLFRAATNETGSCSPPTSPAEARKAAGSQSVSTRSRSASPTHARRSSRIDRPRHDQSPAAKVRSLGSRRYRVATLGMADHARATAITKGIAESTRAAWAELRFPRAHFARLGGSVCAYCHASDEDQNRNSSQVDRSIEQNF